MAKVLTYPERVNRYNFEKMKTLVMRGSNQHPGANMVFTNDGGDQMGHALHVLGRQQRESVANSLKIGDVVERQLQDGDCVLFNR